MFRKKRVVVSRFFARELYIIILYKRDFNPRKTLRWKSRIWKVRRDSNLWIVIWVFPNENNSAK